MRDPHRFVDAGKFVVVAVVVQYLRLRGRHPEDHDKREWQVSIIILAPYIVLHNIHRNALPSGSYVSILGAISGSINYIMCVCVCVFTYVINLLLLLLSSGV